MHTQEIEQMWVEEKMHLKRAIRPGPYLQSHLDKMAWRKLRENQPKDLFEAFLEDVAQ